MLIGYNTNVSYNDKVYHVQTEDRGCDNPTIVTLLYYQGAILHSKKTNYSHIIGKDAFEEKLRGLMKDQHKEIILQLLKGSLTGESPEKGQAQGEEEKYVVIKKQSEDVIVKASEKPAAPESAPKSLDEILHENIDRRGS